MIWADKRKLGTEDSISSLDSGKIILQALRCETVS